MPNGKGIFVTLDPSDLRKIDLLAKEIGWSRTEFLSWASYHFTTCKDGYPAYIKKPLNELHRLEQERKIVRQ